MSKKICVITGSPRKGGNSSILADAFIEAAKTKGNEVVRHDTGLMNLKGCIACETCYSNGFPCNASRDDGFNEIVPDILSADVIVFAMPLYWYSIPTQIKAFIDRMYSLFIGKQPVTGKDYILMACCMEADESALDGIKGPVDRSAKLLGWNKLGEVLATGVAAKGDVNNTGDVKKAEELADLL